METVMPGETMHTTHPVPYDKASSLLYLIFRDSAGISWALSPDGSLKESRSPWGPSATASAPLYCPLARVRAPAVMK
jgi:hypothetical protein